MVGPGVSGGRPCDVEMYYNDHVVVSPPVHLPLNHASQAIMHPYTQAEERDDDLLAPVTGIRCLPTYSVQVSVFRGRSLDGVNQNPPRGRLRTPLGANCGWR